MALKEMHWKNIPLLACLITLGLIITISEGIHLGRYLDILCKLEDCFLEGPAGIPAIVYMLVCIAQPIEKGFSDSQLIRLK